MADGTMSDGRWKGPDSRPSVIVPSAMPDPMGSKGSMRFSTFIARNMLNRKARTSLTVLGLSVGIAAVMILTGIAWGFERSFMAIYRSKGIDLVVVRAGISNQLSSNLDAGLADRIRSVDGV